MALRPRVHDGGALRRPTPGVLRAADAVARYEERSGRAVHDLDWHEVFALVRALAVNDRLQRIAGDRRRRANPMATVLLARLEAAAAAQ